VGGGQRSLPVAALVQLAIAQQGKDPIRAAIKLAGQGHPHGDGKPVPEGARVVLDPRHGARGMANQARTVLAQRVELLPREEPFVGQHGIEGLHGVPLGLDVPIPVRIAKGLG